MKESIISICEKNFILRAAAEENRLDGRKPDEFRNLKLYFGSDYGLCYVSLGETKVLAQVSCEIQEPKTSRPIEGLLNVYVELSPMAAAHFEAGRNQDLSVHINRLLEKCIKLSKAVDLESLCIVAEEKVWALRVDINVLNHDGSIVDCASVAALAALAHFKRPDVTSDGQEIKVHSPSERDPIPITLHHYPICVSFALLNDGENVLADPTAIEERVSDASLVFGINAYRELCALHLGGIAITKPNSILKYSTKAAKHTKKVVQMIKDALKSDNEARQSGKRTGFLECFDWDTAISMAEDRLKVQLNKFTLKASDNVENNQNQMESNLDEIVDLGDHCAELIPLQEKSAEIKSVVIGDQIEDVSPPPSKVMKKMPNPVDISISNVGDTIGEGGPSKWGVDLQMKPTDIGSDSSDSEKDDEILVVPIEPKKVETLELSGDSEEEEVLILDSSVVDDPRKKSKNASPIRKVNKSERSSNNRPSQAFGNSSNKNQTPGNSQGKNKKKKRKNKNYL